MRREAAAAPLNDADAMAGRLQARMEASLTDVFLATQARQAGAVHLKPSDTHPWQPVRYL